MRSADGRRQDGRDGAVHLPRAGADAAGTEGAHSVRGAKLLALKLCQSHAHHQTDQFDLVDMTGGNRRPPSVPLSQRKQMSDATDEQAQPQREQG